ncbi:hypothetical protein [Yersinia phage vB_YenM_P778]
MAYLQVIIPVADFELCKEFDMYHTFTSKNYRDTVRAAYKKCYSADVTGELCIDYQDVTDMRAYQQMTFRFSLSDNTLVSGFLRVYDDEDTHSRS